MNCPKCQEGTIERVVFKRSKRVAHVCDYCESLWFEGETIGISPSHTLGSFSQDEDLGFTIDESREEDQDHQPIRRIND